MVILLEVISSPQYLTRASCLVCFSGIASSPLRAQQATIGILQMMGFAPGFSTMRAQGLRL
jgi:hypothetical protein